MGPHLSAGVACHKGLPKLAHKSLISQVSRIHFKACRNYSFGTESLPVLGGKRLGGNLRTIGAKKLAFFVEHLFPSSTQQRLNV